MIERVVISALVMGFVAFLIFQWLLTQDYSLEQAQLHSTADGFVRKYPCF